MSGGWTVESVFTKCHSVSSVGRRSNDLMLPMIWMQPTRNRNTTNIHDPTASSLQRLPNPARRPQTPRVDLSDPSNQTNNASRIAEGATWSFQRHLPMAYLELALELATMASGPVNSLLRLRGGRLIAIKFHHWPLTGGSVAERRARRRMLAPFSQAAPVVKAHCLIQLVRFKTRPRCGSFGCQTVEIGLALEVIQCQNAGLGFGPNNTNPCELLVLPQGSRACSFFHGLLLSQRIFFRRRQ